MAKTSKRRRQKPIQTANEADADAARSRRVEELTAILRFDPRVLVDSKGRMKALDDLPESVRIALDKVERDPLTGRIRRVTFKSKVDAAEEVSRILGFDQDPNFGALLRDARKAWNRTTEIADAMATFKEGPSPSRVVH